MIGKTDVILAPTNEVFCVTYTFKFDKRVFYKFFGTRYEQNQDRLKFTDARVPICIPLGASSLFVGQEIQPPELDKRTATIFILRMQKPMWFDRTELELDAEDIEVRTESAPASAFEHAFGDALADNVLRGK